ncbi:MAG: redoxin domain-containing protein [Planctomycetaceae bacterium]|nr:redoxin domain-containing protein [Planctomycetaceae bacterium]
MTRIGVLLCLLVWLSAACGPHAIAAASERSFEATSLNGGTFRLAPGAGSDWTVVCFLGAECPMAKLYAGHLQQLSAEYASRGVTFVGINSNRQDSVQDVRRYVDVHAVKFPFIKDRDNVIANRFGAERTPEVYVLDAELQVRYHGRIDDQYSPGVARQNAASRYLINALEDLLAGREVAVPETKLEGCFIGKVVREENVTDNDVTYAKDVVPVLNRHCVECHREGDIGPFAMNSYDEVAGWAATMMETIDDGRMPPWHADPQHGSFANARHMPEADRQILRDWIAGGVKPGDLTKVPPAPEFAHDWQMGREPDLVVSMSQTMPVPRDGTVEYHYFVSTPVVEEDTWITAAEIRPGDRSVVHHAIVFIRPPDDTLMRGIGWLTAYVPGQRLRPLPPGRARLIPKGSRLVFQMHYTPNGRETEDQTEIGLYIAKDRATVTHEVVTLMGINQEFTIPPNTPDHRVEAEVGWLPDDGELLAVAPHMHFRGRSFRVFETGHKEEPLLNVTNYDFNWQHTYIFETPLKTRDLAGLRFEAGFDNSNANPFNPNADEYVTWGDQTWEEMAVAFYEVSMPRSSDWTGRLMGRPDDDGRPTLSLDELVQKWMDLDANKDGAIVQDEAPIVVRFFTFDRLDRDGDGRATEQEIRRTLKRLYR